MYKNDFQSVIYFILIDNLQQFAITLILDIKRLHKSKCITILKRKFLYYCETIFSVNQHHQPQQHCLFKNLSTRFRMVMRNLSKTQQPEQIAENSSTQPMGLSKNLVLKGRLKLDHEQKGVPSPGKRTS